MTKRLLTYLTICLTIALAPSIVKAQSISLGHTTPAANSMRTGGLSYTYSIGKMGRIITAPKNDDAPSTGDKAASSGAKPTARAITVKAYPNPFVQQLIIKPDTPFADDNAQIQIIDSKGKLIATMQTGTSDADELTIDAAHLAPGKYIIKIITKNCIYTATAIKI
jgi:hypothetical protein